MDGLHPTAGVLQGEVLSMMEALRYADDGISETFEQNIGGYPVRLTMTRDGDNCHVSVECPSKQPTLLTYPLFYDDATEENNDTFEIAGAMCFIIDKA
jgi:hypothetical protein